MPIIRSCDIYYYRMWLLHLTWFYYNFSLFFITGYFWLFFLMFCMCIIFLLLGILLIWWVLTNIYCFQSFSQTNLGQRSCQSCSCSVRSIYMSSFPYLRKRIDLSLKKKYKQDNIAIVNLSVVMPLFMGFFQFLMCHFFDYE